MKPIRSSLNIVLMILYIVLYLIAPAVFLFLGLDRVEMHGFFRVTYAFAGIGMLFFIISGMVLIFKYFPHKTTRSLLIIMPVVLNYVLYFVFNRTDDFLNIFIINSSIVFSSLVFSIFISTFLIPWDAEKSLKNKEETSNLKSLKDNLRYLKKNPVLWISFAVFLLPLMAAVHFFSMGLILVFSGQLQIETIVSVILFVAAFSNVSVFHIRETMKHFLDKD